MKEILDVFMHVVEFQLALERECVTIDREEISNNAKQERHEDETRPESPVAEEQVADEVDESDSLHEHQRFDSVEEIRDEIGEFDKFAQKVSDLNFRSVRSASIQDFFDEIHSAEILESRDNTQIHEVNENFNELEERPCTY